MTPQYIIDVLDLAPHPEGGWYRETLRVGENGQRADITAIYFLLEGGQKSAWHRVDATEIWLWQAGAPLELTLCAQKGEPYAAHILSNQIEKGHTPQGVVPKSYWQSAESLGDWTLVSCVVAPGFEFSGFEMAPTGWSP